MIMEEESKISNDGGKSEAEDLFFSDAEGMSSGEEDILLSIDYNARVVSNVEKDDSNQAENYDMHFVDKADFYSRRGSENRLHTSVEDLNISDEEEQSYNALTLQTVNLDGIACISSKKDLSSLSTHNYSRTGFKDEYSSNEYASDEEMGSKTEERFFIKDKLTRLPPGITLACDTVDKANSSVSSRNKKALTSLNVKNAFSKSLIINESDIHDLYDEPESPLMTCLEFLKSEITDDYETDAEDLSLGSLSDICEKSKQNRNPCKSSCYEFSLPKSALPPENVLHIRGAGILYPGDSSRRSSAAGFLTEDETLNLENFSNVGRKRLKKRSYLLVDKNEVSEDSLTDEEVLDEVNNREWTETDDTGGVRQITHIKTETSIKLEGEGDDLGIEGDDIISRTTTTTRIVTTVTTDGEEESHEDQHIMEDGDDLRHSVEVILNQFMSSDSDATKPEDSITEHDE